MADRKLATRLLKVRGDVESNVPAVARATDRLVASLIERNVAASALRTGDRIPSFSLPDYTGRLVSSEEMLADGPLVLSFYRGIWCPFCRSELEALNAAAPEFGSLGASIASIAGETGGRNARAAREHKLGFRVLCDIDLGVSLSFGLVYPLSAELRELFLGLGLNFPDVYGNNSWFLPIPATYVVRQDGVIAADYVDPDFRNRLDPVDIIKALRALK